MSCPCQGTLAVSSSCTTVVLSGRRDIHKPETTSESEGERKEELVSSPLKLTSHGASQSLIVWEPRSTKPSVEAFNPSVLFFFPRLCLQRATHAQLPRCCCVTADAVTYRRRVPCRQVNHHALLLLILPPCRGHCSGQLWPTMCRYPRPLLYLYSPPSCDPRVPRVSFPRLSKFMHHHPAIHTVARARN